ncbi:MAG: cadherin-like domain-containing protein [Proteobacteria bacterium]|nr:cadherin-like domain-containing protein [Pseudomonadota bacterium]MBU1716359.1 cadherin-like domain-containing protein [Pseudomonadota bacterium]
MANNGVNQTSVGQVVVAHGLVFLETPSGLEPLSVGNPVYHESIVVTKDGGQVEVKFDDGTILSQGANSRMTVDDYVFDSAGSSPSSLLFQMGQGAFRVITGKIADQNPENFNVKTPLATIGIRGTDFSIETGVKGDLVLVGEISENHILVVEDQFGSVRFINYSGMEVIVEETAGIQEIRRASPEEIDRIQSLLPITSYVPTDEGEGDGHHQGNDGSDSADNAADGDASPGDQVKSDQYDLFGHDDTDLFQQSADQNGQHTSFGDQYGDNGLVSVYGRDNSFLNGGQFANDGLLISQGNQGVNGAVVDLVLTGGDEDNIFDGQGGNDLLIGGGGNDLLNGGDGNDIISGGGGADQILGGAGDDTLVIWGTFAQNYYNGLDAARGNLAFGNGSSQLMAGETINGGSGFDTIVTYGTTNYSQVNLIDIEAIEMHSDTTFGAGQLNAAGVEIITGDGGSILRFTGNGVVDLSAIDTSGIITIEIGPGVTVLVSQANLFGLQNIIGSGHLMPGPGVTTLDLFGINVSGSIDTFENDAPYDISLSSNSVVENMAGAPVGTLSVLDPDAGDTHQFTLLTGGDYFEIVGNELQLKDSVQLDYENPPGNLTVTVQVADALGATYEQEFTINIIDANDPPTEILLDNMTVAENSPGAVVGTLDALDQNPEDSHEFAIISGGSDFEIVDGQLKLKDGVSLDYENPPNDLNIVIEATDPYGLSMQQTLTIAIGDANDSPVAMADQAGAYSNAAVQIDVISNDVDQDAGDVLTVNDVDTSGTLGNVTLNADQTITYDPTAAFASLPLWAIAYDSFSYTISDGHGGTSSAEVTIEIIGQPAGPNVIMGTAGNDTLTGTVDVDLIFGLAGNDTLFGMGGNDTLDGGSGMDTLLGGAGRDNLTGGLGVDVFSFWEMGPANADLIADFFTTYTSSLDDDISLDSGAFPGLEMGPYLLAGVWKTFTTPVSNGYSNKTASTTVLVSQYVYGNGVVPGAYSNPQTFHLTATFATGPASTVIYFTLSHPYVAYNSANGRLYYDSDGGMLNNNATIATLNTSGGGHPAGAGLNYDIIQLVA